MKTLLFLSLAMLPRAASASYGYAELDRFAAHGEKLVAATRAAHTEADRAALIAQTRELIQDGVAILKIYGEKYPACREQFSAFIAALPGMDSLSLSEVKAGYHDGAALPSAPRYCYLGRSETVHPVMNLVRLKGEWNERVRADVVDDFEEVIDHLARIQRNLDHPQSL
jgi:hypothetical protein